MAVYEQEGISFSVPDKPTVRQQLEYVGASSGSGKDLVVKKWDGAKALIQDWKCELAPDLEEIDIDTETNPDVAAVITWAAMRVWEHMNSLEGVPKN